MTITAHTLGTRRSLSPTEWAILCANCLGAGFRVDLPAGSQRPDAAVHELIRVRRLASVLGLEVAEDDWVSATRDHPDLDVEVVGGWPRTYASEPTMWVAAIAVRPAVIATTSLIDRPADSGPTSDLPTLSRLADETVLRSIDADCGLWADHRGVIVSSTAGPVIAERSDGVWVTGTHTGSWLASRVAAERTAPAKLTTDDLASARFLGLIHRATGVLPLTYVAASRAR